MVLTQLTGSGLMAMASLGLATGASSTDTNAVVEQAFTYPTAAPQQDHIASAAAAAVNAALGIGTSATKEASNGKTAGDTNPPAVTQTADSDPKEVRGTLSRKIMVHNVFDKNEETEEGWEEDIKEDFEEECSKHGTIKTVKVESEKEGGIIYVLFDSVDAATACAKALAGRWFDKRQLKVEYVPEESV
mmetsp:Transcript_10787/g.13371  ORF Transcript_10787/g.13371 Transcript_10787/m.13371 type:complete len:189 (+) Transcript_10787:338-904(+)